MLEMMMCKRLCVVALVWDSLLITMTPLFGMPQWAESKAVCVSRDESQQLLKLSTGITQQLYDN